MPYRTVIEYGEAEYDIAAQPAIRRGVLAVLASPGQANPPSCPIPHPSINGWASFGTTILGFGSFQHIWDGEPIASYPLRVLIKTEDAEDAFPRNSAIPRTWRIGFGLRVTINHLQKVLNFHLGRKNRITIFFFLLLLTAFRPKIQ